MCSSSWTQIGAATNLGRFTRIDKVATSGTVSLRYAGQLRHLGIGRAHANQPVLMLIHDQHVITSHAETGQVLTEHHIDPTEDYQRPTRTTVINDR